MTALGSVFVASWVLSAGLATRMYLLLPGSSRWDHVLSTQIPGSTWLQTAVKWMPAVLSPHLHVPVDYDPRLVAAVSEYVALLLVQFALYLGLWYMVTKRAAIRSAASPLLPWIIAVGLACSLVMLFSPSIPSDDPIAYGAIARLFGTYHANPYFVVPAAYPHDTLLTADAWARATDAYGPSWTLLSALLNPLIAGDPVRSVMVFRGVALAAHAANMLLIATTRTSRAAAWRERAVLLYAWNPLVIIEVGAGHNDVLLLTLCLTAIALIRRRHLYAGYGTLTTAALFKASAVPLLVVALLALWLSCTTRGRGSRDEQSERRPMRVASLCGGLVVLGYAPFLWGHTPREISRAVMWQGTAQGLMRTLQAFFARTTPLIVSAPLLPRPLARWLGQVWTRLDSPSVWIVGCALILGITLVAVLPMLRRRSGLTLGLAWVYAAWLGYLAVVNLLHTWYIVPLVGLAALASQSPALRRFVWTVTLLVNLEAIFLLPLGWLQAWNIWQGLLAFVPALLVARPALRHTLKLAQRAPAVLHLRLAGQRVAQPSPVAPGSPASKGTPALSPAAATSQDAA